MYKRIKLLHNLDELEEDEEVELQLEDQMILEKGQINEKDDVLFNRDMKTKVVRDFHRKQQIFEEVRRFLLWTIDLNIRTKVIEKQGVTGTKDLLGKYNDIDFTKRGVYLDYDKEGNLRTESKVGGEGGKSMRFW